MQSLRDKNRRKNTKTKIIASIAMLVLFLVIAPMIFPALGKGLRQVFAPLWNLENNIGGNTKNFFANFKSKRALEAENTALKNKILEQETQLAERKVLQQENDALKELYGRKPASAYVLASILVKPGRSLYDTVVIDAGSNLGVANGALVYAFQTVPVGTITSVTATTSTVTLFSTSGQKTNGRLEEKNIDVELLGRGGGNFELKIPRDISLEPNMNVLLPGIHSAIVAVVAKSITDPRDPVQTFLLTSPVNINELTWLEVAK